MLRQKKAGMTMTADGTQHTIGVVHNGQWAPPPAATRHPSQLVEDISYAGVAHTQGHPHHH